MSELKYKLSIVAIWTVAIVVMAGLIAGTAMVINGDLEYPAVWGMFLGLIFFGVNRLRVWSAAAERREGE